MKSASRAAIDALIVKAYPPPAWGVFFEVSDQTGFMASRRADAVAIGIWPSRGHALIGFEVKTDRRDWLRELKAPAKAETIAAHCDAWWLVIGDPSVARLEEVPAPWGLLLADPVAGKTKVLKTAEPFQRADTMRRSFAAAMLRKVSETTVPKATVDALVAERVAAGVAAELKHHTNGAELERLREQVKTYQAQLEAFHAASGIDLRHRYEGPTKIGTAVAAVLSGERHRRALEHTATALRQTVAGIDQALAAWPDTDTKPEDPIR